MLNGAFGSRRAVFGFLVLALVSCGGGGAGGGSAGGGSIQGVWFGAFEDPISDLHTIQLTIDANGNIVEERVDGVTTGLTGTTHWLQAASGGDVYAILMSDGTEGGFVVDTARTHAGFVDEDYNFGAVQKEALALGTPYVAGDARGHTFIGPSVFLDATFDLAGTGTATASIAPGGTFDGTESFQAITFTEELGSTFVLQDGNFGRYFARYSSTIPENGSMTVIATPDKVFWAAYAWPDGVSRDGFPQEFGFYFMRRQ